MTAFSQHVEDYLRLRRSFGYKLDEAARVCRASPLVWRRPAPSS
jgi:hypothetical protein